jgi:hypothetical protein
MESGSQGGSAPLELERIQGHIAGFGKPFQSFGGICFEDGDHGRDLIARLKTLAGS